ncbi:MAG: metallophosphoesterase family protein [Planctomycetota bacterium]
MKQEKPDFASRPTLCHQGELIPALRAFVLVSVCCISRASVVAHDSDDHTHHAVKRVGRAEMYAPSAIPDRVVLTLSGDSRTSQSVTWRTSMDVETGIAEIALAKAGPDFPKDAASLVAASETLKTDLSLARYHSVTFGSLLPGKTYAYRVGDGTNWSEWLQFRTAAANVEPFSFVYFGDAQNDVRSKWSRVVREAFRDAPKAAFFLHAGDLVNRAESDGEWGEWFGAGAWLNAMIPVIAVPGNHEQAKDDDQTRRLSHHWRRTFTFAENGPPGLEETCYTLTYHNLRIIALDSNRMHETQAVWMDRVLSANECPWVVCTFHHPIYSTGRGRDNAELRALWKPIFDKHRVDLVLQGHDHTYGRTGFEVPDEQNGREGLTAVANDATAGHDEQNLRTGLQKQDRKNGTIYVVSVSGPKMYHHARSSFMRRVAEDTQLYQVIQVDGERLRFEARTAIGQLYDAFELTKQAGSERNQLRELNPEVGVNLRPATAE